MDSVRNGLEPEAKETQMIYTNVTSSEESIPQTYTIGGVKVTFPTRAYPSQIAMMDKVIRGINTTQNCLLESPTGTGKTLALLCSALAWQRKERERVLTIPIIDLDLEEKKKSSPQEYQSVPASEEGCFSSTGNSKYLRLVCDGDQDAENFVSQPHKKSCVRTIKEIQHDGVCPPTKNTSGTTYGAHDKSWSQFCDDNASCNMDESFDMVQPQPNKQPRVPRIYYGTRTHKQIEQVISELGKTSYKDARMTVLSSREHSCIQEISGKYKNKTELCKELMDPVNGSHCYFYSNVHRIGSQTALSDHKFSSPWDIEDLVVLGKTHKACPYFAARSLLSTSELVFCPYNYLVDPNIRQSLQINLSGDIIILDEAHNIEDVTRDCASYALNEKDLINAIGELNSIADFTSQPQNHRSVASTLGCFSHAIDALKEKIKFSEYDQGTFVMNGHEAVAFFKIHGLGTEELANFQHCAQVVVSESVNPENREKNFRVVSSSARTILDGLLLVLDFLYNNLDDYRVVLTRTMTRSMNESLSGRTRVSWTFTLNFWCQNPSIVFFELKENVRTIILSSGTLSPMDTFQSELNTRFPIQLETNHVIQKSNVWVGSVPCGPSGIRLCAQYKNTDSYQFQDELGCLILEICRMIPHGVLCFFPSYKLLEKLVQRWRDTDVWSELESVKNIVQEPRRTDQLSLTMQTFYDSIQSSSNQERTDLTGQTGSLFLAVVRGKVSEGFDFADNNARAVIAVGIPYPNYTDIQVKLKQDYNNLNCKRKGLLPGRAWYDIQAYRALNQALGRCIRHKNDWGAIFLIDSRFSQSNAYTKGLSKWIRNQLQHYNSWNTVQKSLRAFLKIHLGSTTNLEKTHFTSQNE